MGTVVKKTERDKFFSYGGIMSLEWTAF